MASAGSVIAQSTQLLIRMNENTFALLGYVSGDLFQIRRDNIRPYVSEDFYSLCSTQVPLTDYLFGKEDDLQTRIAYPNQFSNKKSIYSNRDKNQKGKLSFSQYFWDETDSPQFRQKQWQGAMPTQNKSRVSGNMQS